ncbi:hypothetical protein AX762_07355 [Alkalibacterium sp. 20]|nr:hypothetical protein AX762_07355 [Alkalibacterium sp. 20]
MKRQLTEELEHDFFFVHQSIVYGVLKKCGISYNHPDYDDYVQVGLMKLVGAYESFPEDLRCEEYLYQFTGYAFQKIRWAIIDEMRRSMRKQEKETVLPEEMTEWKDPKVDAQTDDWITWELFYTMLQCLSVNEQNLLKALVFHQRTVTEVATEFGVSRKTVYGWKKQIARKLAHFETVLKN